MDPTYLIFLPYHHKLQTGDTTPNSAPLFSRFSREPSTTPIFMAASTTTTTFSLLLLLILCTFLSPSQSSSSSSSNGHQTFIVHVSKTHRPSHFTSNIHPTKLLYTYKTAVHGFSAQLTPSEATALRRDPAILSVVPDIPRHPHTTRTPHFLNLSDQFGLWPTSHYADDVIIGVLDTGIWPDRRSFSDANLSDIPSRWKGICETSPDFPATSCNKKIIGARAYYRGYQSHLGGPITREPISPRDTEGHGTHTASTAAGSLVSDAAFYQYAGGEARGMAIRARIAVYKICWSLGCFDSDILAAMDQAISDGVDVISLSVGATGYAPEYDHDSIAIGAFGAVENGVVVSCSAGNSGPGPETGVNIAPWIVTVGASTIDREFPAVVVLGDGREFSGVSLYSGEGLPEFKVPLVYGAHAGSRYCYTGTLLSSVVEGKIVVCDRGGNARVEKGFAVKSVGGLGMILANTAQSGEELIADSHVIPSTMVGEIAGNKIKEYIKLSQYPTATIVFRGTVVGGPTPAPKVAAFSSRGPNHLTPEILKPDVIAPGVNILAAWTGATAPTDLDIDPRRVEFNIISGTSMSCPHVSGLAALLRKAYPNWLPSAIKSALMTTAYNLDKSGGKIKDLASGDESTPFVHGAGHVDPNRALNPGLVYDINVADYVAFLCSIGYDAKRIAIFVRAPTSLDVCSNKLSRPGNLNYPSFAVVFGSYNDVVTYKRVVKNVGSSMDAVYEVKVNAPPRVEINVSPSKLVFSAEKTTLSYEVTFSSAALGGPGVKSHEFGSIEWSDGDHLVRSPIAVKWLQGSVDSMK